MVRSKPWQLPKKEVEESTIIEEELVDALEPEPVELMEEGGIMLNEPLRSPEEKEELYQRVTNPTLLETEPNPICAWKDCPHTSIKVTESGVGLCSFHFTESLSNGGKINFGD
jgi:hypothetical protein